MPAAAAAGYPARWGISGWTPRDSLGRMATETARRRVRAEITRLARADLDNDGFRLAAADVLRKAVGFDWWCWTLLDPAADLPTRYLSNNPIIGGAQRLFYRMLPDAAQPSPEWQSRRPVTICPPRPAGTCAAAGCGGSCSARAAAVTSWWPG